jgi:hypothetical protein
VCWVVRTVFTLFGSKHVNLCTGEPVTLLAPTIQHLCCSYFIACLLLKVYSYLLSEVYRLAMFILASISSQTSVLIECNVWKNLGTAASSIGNTQHHMSYVI